MKQLALLPALLLLTLPGAVRSLVPDADGAGGSVHRNLFCAFRPLPRWEDAAEVVAAKVSVLCYAAQAGCPFVDLPADDILSSATEADVKQARGRPRAPAPGPPAT